ncbi:MAG TPA: hypothetical protein P5205_21980 [Candidatus Paceibacterota bacterium]|nr:hypothetical protein [Verrucomicrobiota bacterium]HSA13032.1 hypothetical protein [Candidatus Paceibacterota bacterium]
MKTNTANATPVGRTVRETFGPALLLAVAATALLLQGCTTARPGWSSSTDTNPLSGNAFERMEPREGIALVNFNF